MDNGPSATTDHPSGNSRDRAYGSFTRHLLSKDLRAGQFVSQRELVELTGLTLAAVRELIPRLEAEGLVRTVPKRGMQIVHVDLNMVRDAFQFRAFLEVGAIRIFTQIATSETVSQLRASHEDIISRCEAALKAGQISEDLVAQAQAVDWSLHQTIIASLANRIVEDAYRSNAIKIRLIKQEQTRLNSNLVIPTMQEHLRVIEAIASQEPEVAAAAIEDHIEKARVRALEQR